MKRTLTFCSLSLLLLAALPVISSAQDGPDKPEEPKEAPKEAPAKKDEAEAPKPSMRTVIWEYRESRAKADPENTDFWGVPSATIDLKIHFDEKFGKPISWAFAKDTMISTDGKTDLRSELWGDADANGLVWQEFYQSYRELPAGQSHIDISLEGTTRQATKLTMKGGLHLLFASGLEDKTIEDLQKKPKGDVVYEDKEADVYVRLVHVEDNQAKIKISGDFKKVLKPTLLDADGNELYCGTNYGPESKYVEYSYYAEKDQLAALTLKFQVAKTLETKEVKFDGKDFDLP